MTQGEAMSLAAQVVEGKIPYVMLCGGEPTLVPHFLELAEALGRGGVYLKIETNAQGFGEAQALRLSGLPIRSIQVSIDGAVQETYARMRPGASLEKVKQACRIITRLGMPLEITFAPTRLNIHEAEAVMALAAELGAFRFNTGRLMRLGRASRLWERLESSEQDWGNYYKLLERKERELSGRMELCFRPFSIQEALSQEGPSGTLLVLPDGKVKVSAALPYFCADLKSMSLRQAWEAYGRAWRDPRTLAALRRAAQEEALPSRADDRVFLEENLPVAV